jgi:hypothetical protein
MSGVKVPLALSPFFTDAGLDEIGHDGKIVLSEKQLPQVLEAARRHSVHLSVLGRTKNRADGEIIAIVTKEPIDGDDVKEPGGQGAARREVRRKGTYKAKQTPEEGEFTISTDELIAAAEHARAEGFSMALIGPAGQNPKSASVLLKRGESITGGFPQDFWIERARSSANLSEAVLAVVERRS